MIGRAQLVRYFRQRKARGGRDVGAAQPCPEGIHDPARRDPRGGASVVEERRVLHVPGTET